MMKYIVGLLATAAIALGVDVTFVWEANPPEEGITEYRIYEVEGGAYTLKTTVDGNTLRGTVAGLVMDKDRVFVATAFNGLESYYSNSAIVKAQPTVPKGLTVEVIVKVTVGGQ